LAIAVGEGGIWVANRLNRSVSRIDPGTNQVTATIDLRDRTDGFPNSIAAGEGAVWVGIDDATDDAIQKIDPQSNKVVASIPCPDLQWLVVTTGEGFV